MGKNQNRRDNGQFGAANLGATAPETEGRAPAEIPLPNSLSGKTIREGEPTIEEVYNLLLANQAMMRTINSRLDEMNDRIGSGGQTPGGADDASCSHPAYRFLHDRIEQDCEACSAGSEPCQLQICIECGASLT